MKNYKIVAPPQKHMTLEAIFEIFGSRPVVAYRCKLDEEGVPTGGFVLAVQNEPKGSIAGIKSYMSQLKQRHPEREPICFLCVQEPKPGVLGLIHDKGSGDIRTLQKIKVKTSKAEEMASRIPDELLAKAVASAFLEGKE